MQNTDNIYAQPISELAQQDSSTSVFYNLAKKSTRFWTYILDNIFLCLLVFLLMFVYALIVPNLVDSLEQSIDQIPSFLLGCLFIFIFSE